MAVTVLVGAYFFAKEGAHMAESKKAEEGKICIVVDAGHGGADPGKVGINKAEEQDVNLQIAKKLKKLLETDGIEVVMTRTDKNGLYDENANNKKVDDMRKRCNIIENAKPVFTISIHQNSYPEEYVKGAQVFYYGESAEGKKLADVLQGTLIEQLDPENHRQAKANASYYLLKKTSSPTVIVECGFLSNSQEASLLVTKEYQKKVAEAVHKGIVQYLNESGLKIEKKNSDKDSVKNSGKDSDKASKKNNEKSSEKSSDSCQNPKK